jgi:hypothetical protein
MLRTLALFIILGKIIPLCLSNLYRLEGPEYHVFITRYLLQHVSADLYGRHHVVVQIHKKKSILQRGLPFTDTKYLIAS